MFTIKSSFDGKAQFLVSFGAFLTFACYVCGLCFGVGITGLILAHEAGHFFDVRRRGLTAKLPVFLPGVGAYVRTRLPASLTLPALRSVWQVH
jgi:hypothetical protein